MADSVGVDWLARLYEERAKLAGSSHLDLVGSINRLHRWWRRAAKAGNLTMLRIISRKCDVLEAAIREELNA